MSFENHARAALQQSTGWITSQRWFGDKARPITAVQPEVVDVVEIEGRQAALALVRFSFEWGPDARYFIPVVAANEGREFAQGVGDALGDAAFLRWFVDGFAAERALENAGSWSWESLGAGLPDPDSVDFDHARAISGEQSNTSIVFDRRFIGKMFRRVQAGLNPDLEIGAFLTENDRFTHAPKLYGLVQLQSDDETVAVAAMQEFVPNNGDGWTWLLGQLRAMTPETVAGCVEAVRLLARRTGELHVALASDPDDPAFAPEPFTDTDAQALIGRVVAEIEESVEGLAREISPEDVERIHKGMGQLMGHAYTLVGTAKIRVHGDYHLGQTLRTADDDFMLIDFEGEPSRTMEQRRMKLPALKDVAGMVRSLDYAAATILHDNHDDEAEVLVGRWLDEATAAYIDEYRSVVSTASTPLAPSDDSAFRRALDLMIAEKALYEVRYELNNRPDWLPIPLNALRRLVGMDIPAARE